VQRDGDADLAAPVHVRKRLTTVERGKAWASPDVRPCPVMVWLPAHCGKFLDTIEGERLFAAFTFTMFSGLRQDEIVGLNWAEVDLDEGVAYVRETGSGDDPKSDAGTRAVPLSAVVAKDLKAWRKAQAAERLAWGPDWTDTGRVFTHEDGQPITGQWLSRRFATLAWRADLPYVRFHDLRHGAASLAKAAGASSKEISAQLGHSRQSFTDTTYVTVFPDVAKGAAEAAAPSASGHENRDLPKTTSPENPWSSAEDRGFEPRRVLPPNRISSAVRPVSEANPNTLENTNVQVRRARKVGNRYFRPQGRCSVRPRHGHAMGLDGGHLAPPSPVAEDARGTRASAAAAAASATSGKTETY
jgi:hypothetical protein